MRGGAGEEEEEELVKRKPTGSPLGFCVDFYADKCHIKPPKEYSQSGNEAQCAQVAGPTPTAFSGNWGMKFAAGIPGIFNNAVSCNMEKFKSK